MRIAKNQESPVFIANDYLGNEIDLSSYKGKKVLLSFFRGASCPFCNLRVHEMVKKHSDLSNKGLEMITFYAGTVDEIKNYAGKQNPPFPVIADPKLEFYKIFGIESSLSGMFKAMMRMSKMMKLMFGGFFNLKSMSDKPILPADFLIDENGIINKAYYGSDFGDHIELSEIEDWLNN